MRETKHPQYYYSLGPVIGERRRKHKTAFLISRQLIIAQILHIECICIVQVLILPTISQLAARPTVATAYYVHTHSLPNHESPLHFSIFDKNYIHIPTQVFDL